MLVLIDNYDSFTFNIAQYLDEIGAAPVVVKNDAATVLSLEAGGVDRLVVSPGPGRPEQSGICLDCIRHFSSRIPIFGICLGHQAIAQAFGGAIVHARHVAHAKTSAIHHDGTGVFAGLPSPFRAARYHSLIVERASLPAELVVSAWTLSERGDVDEIMGLRHARLPVEGVQFHPEAILSEHGHRMFENFLRLGTGRA